MNDLDWQDIRHHLYTGIAIGLIGGLLSHYEIHLIQSSFNIGWAIIVMNTFAWFIREYLQKPNKERLWTSLQVILEYSVPTIVAWPFFFLGRLLVERFLL